jgi:hypothetical protein
LPGVSASNDTEACGKGRADLPPVSSISKKPLLIPFKGAVFNTLAQLGTSIGLTTMSVISVNITEESRFKNKLSPAALMEGYRATFWTLFAWMVTACLVGGYGLRNLGKIGQKRD